MDTISFDANGQLAVQVDCNHGGGNWESSGNSLTIGPIATTLMGCLEASPLSVQFAQLMNGAVIWSMGDDGLLTLETPGGQTLVFASLGTAETLP
ncbi:MAG: META domain-containing protein [Thermomicrobiales bacterium]